MGFTAQQAQAELASRPKKASNNDISAEEAQAELNSRAQQPTTAQNVESLLAAPGQTLLEGGQALSNIVGGLPGVQPLARGIIGLLPESVRRATGLPPDVRQRLSEALQNRGGIQPQAPTPVKIGGALLGGGTAAALGGEVAGAALKGVPILSKVAQLAEKFPRLARTAGTSAFGALTSPDQRGRGALLGAGLGAGAEALGATPQIVKFGIQKAKGLLKPFAAETDAQNILRDLGQNRNLEDNSKSIALDIKNKKEQIEKESDKNFSPIFKQVGKNDIYTDFPEEGKLFPGGKQQYLKLNKKIFDQYTPDLEELHQEFLNKPTFRNAANLRTELGAESARPGIDILGRRAKQAVTKARQALNNDMFGFLNRADDTKDLSNKYQDAIDFHRDEYVPYKSNRQIWKIATGEVTNPRNITTIFKAPEGEEEGENFTKTSKVLNDLGADAHKKILFNELGKAKNAKDLVNRFKKLDQQRLGSYVSDNLQKRVDGLETKISRKDIAQRAAGGLGGAALGGLSGFPIFGTATGATIGATALPRLLRGLAKRGGVQAGREGARGISRTPQNLQFLTRLLLANRANQQNR